MDFLQGVIGQAPNEKFFHNEQQRKKGIAKLPVNRSVHRPGG